MLVVIGGVLAWVDVMGLGVATSMRVLPVITFLFFFSCSLLVGTSKEVKLPGSPALADRPLQITEITKLQV